MKNHPGDLSRLPFALKNIRNVQPDVVEKLVKRFNDKQNYLRQSDVRTHRVTNNLKWDNTKLMALKYLIKQVEGTKVVVFRPTGMMDQFFLSFDYYDLT